MPEAKSRDAGHPAILSGGGSHSTDDGELKLVKAFSKTLHEVRVCVEEAGEQCTSVKILCCRPPPVMGVFQVPSAPREGHQSQPAPVKPRVSCRQDPADSSLGMT